MHRLAAPLLAAACAALWLLAGPRTPDLAAQVFRTGLFEDHGYTLFNTLWFGGHHTPGYSLTFPPLAALLGPRVVGAIAAVVSAALFARLAHDHFGERAWLGSLWFAAATAADLLIGRLTFALGVAFGLGALLALARRRTALAAALAVGTTASSPVAGLFLAMGGVAHGAATRRPAGLYLAGAAFAPALLLAVAFPEGGTQPFGLWSALCVVAAAVAVWRLLPAEERTLRAAALLYAASTVAAFAISSPMGSNATRLAAAFAGPLLACALLGRARPLVLAAVALPLLVYQWWGPVREVRKGAADPSSKLAYYEPLLDFLEPRAGIDSRVEVPFTRLHWESVHVARRFPLARGWEAQLDREHNTLFAPGTRLDPRRYREWLREHAVRYVALPDVALDPVGRNEGELIRERRPGYLRPVWSNEDWQVFAVAGATSVVEGARLRELEPDAFALDAPRAGALLVRVRWTPYWEVVEGAACVERAGDWTRLRVERPGAIRVAARFDPIRIVDRDPACREVGARR
ncbi:MAG TPA: hypothetical protein VHF89_10880 [Solirubrobacteraceae bacterium]|nr:hypothetical protein [Solirubrobacteraceae bacterium]